MINKDLVRLKLLHDEYEKQKRRILALMEDDCRQIGIPRTAENLGVTNTYLYRLFKGYGITHDTLETLYIKIQEIKNILGIEGKEDK